MSGRGGMALEMRVQDVRWGKNAVPAGLSDSLHRVDAPRYPSADTPGGSLLRRRLGFGYWHDTYGTGYSASSRRLWFPAAVPIALFALLPSIWLRRAYVKGRRRREQRCPTCGYDLRATPDRCPECGTVAEQVSQPAACTTR